MANGQTEMEVEKVLNVQEQSIELAQALEQQRSLKIVADVQALPIGAYDAVLPTQFQAGFQLACEEIAYRLRTEQWELCGVASSICHDKHEPC